MSTATYIDAFKSVQKETFEKFATMPEIDSVEYVKYLKVKANLLHFTQEEITDNPFDLFKKIWLHQELAEIEQRRSYPLEEVTIKGALLQPEEPRIYCSFHLGAYRLINFLLLNHNIDYMLLISKDNMEQHGQIYKNFAARFKRLHNKGGSLDILCAEDERIGFKLIRALKKGKSILAYLDGNSGIGGLDRNDDRLVSVDFLGKKILARKGIAFIAHFLDIPIVPIISYRSNDETRTIEMLPPMYSNKELSREAAAKASTQKLFDLFTSYLKKYPAQWGGWFYFNHFIDKKLLKPTPSNWTFQADQDYSFNQSRYHLFQQETIPYVFDLITQSCISLPKALWDLLLKIQKGEIEEAFLPKLLKETLFNQLLRLEILKPNA